MSDATVPGASAVGPSDEQARLMRLATYASVAVACLLIVVKMGAWGVTGSVAILSSLVDSLLDALASLVNLMAVRQALEPADEEHRFGHGKAEPLAGLGQSAFVCGSGVLLLIEAGARLFDPAPVARSEVGIAVMAFSIIATFALVAFQRYVARKTKSVAISADSLHYAGDVLINGSVIVSLSATAYLGWNWIDPVFALGIALFLVRNAWGIAKSSLNLLMDHEFPEEDRARVVAMASAHPDVINIHDLRTRSSGPQDFIQFHLELDPGLTLARAHAIADAVEIQVRAAFPRAEVIIHQDPAGLAEPHKDFH